MVIHAQKPRHLDPSPRRSRRAEGCSQDKKQAQGYAMAAVGRRLEPPPALLGPVAPGRASVYFANARARDLLQLSFWLPTKLSTVTAMARSMSCAEQYSDRRMRQNASLMRMMASRWRTCGVASVNAGKRRLRRDSP